MPRARIVATVSSTSAINGVLKAVSNADSVAITNYETGAAVSIYAAATGGTALTAPFTTDDFGRVVDEAAAELWADPQDLSIVATKGGESYTIFYPLLSAGQHAKALAQSAVAIVAPANTSENVLATITVPANAMGPNGRLRVWTYFTVAGNVGAKTFRLRLGGAAGTVLASEAFSAGWAALGTRSQIANRNAANSQLGVNERLSWFAAAAKATAAVDTTAQTTLVISFQKVTAADGVTLEQYAVELIPG